MTDKRAPKSEAKLFYVPPGGAVQYTFSSIFSEFIGKKTQDTMKPIQCVTKYFSLHTKAEQSSVTNDSKWWKSTLY